jgi:MoxR-like ATPase
MDTTGPQTKEAALLEQAMFEIKKVIVGQDRVIERLVVCMLARGHCLLEGVPGLAKTLAMETLATVTGGTFARLQFTPDLLPADIVGTRIYRVSSEKFDVELGPVFANFVLADEINRAPAKVQSALLEVMAEKHVSIGGETFPAPLPFLVLATQNPIESEGVYPLPEAQRDRFLMKVLVGYPSGAEEVEIVQRMGVAPPRADETLGLHELVELQAAADQVYVDRSVIDYAVSLVLATREPAKYGLADLTSLVSYGASPRASLGLVAAGRGLALLRGRTYALPQDVFDVAPDILRHRLVLSYEALAREISADHVLARVLSTVPAPRIAPSQDSQPVA